MSYYGEDKMYFWVNGIVVQLTEEQAEHYQSTQCGPDWSSDNEEDDIVEGLETANETDYVNQCFEVQDAGTPDEWVKCFVVLWVNGNPTLVEDLELEGFMLEHSDDDVSDEYVTQRDATSDDDNIDCKCHGDYTCPDCYSFFQSLLDED